MRKNTTAAMIRTVMVMRAQPSFVDHDAEKRCASRAQHGLGALQVYCRGEMTTRSEHARAGALRDDRGVGEVEQWRCIDDDDVELDDEILQYIREDRTAQYLLGIPGLCAGGHDR